MRITILFLAILIVVGPASAAPLLVLSIDGLDYRYLRDADRLGLRIPNLRRLVREGSSAAGVIGVWPTVTWPSHTSLITGVRPDQHGIRGNRRPPSEGGEYYWSASLLKARTLWQMAHDEGRKTGAITWPVTVDAAIDYNLPEFFRKRNGGGMDLASIEEKGTPGLVAAISRMFPSFPREWMDDRARALAVVYLLKEKRPDLLLVHFVDHDAEAHENGPFSREANATVEYTDELIGEILAALPRDYVVAIVSDHGFERVDRVVNIPALMTRDHIEGEVQAMGGLVLSRTPESAGWLRRLAKDEASGVGREIPASELSEHAPELQGAAFEPSPHNMFGSQKTEPYSKPREKGNHGFWPERAGYRSVFVLWGPGIRAGAQPEVKMTSIADRLRSVMK
jgi:predicted AlkP superfamily pyrophosphatase or phosphodiesterase